MNPLCKTGWLAAVSGLLLLTGGVPAWGQERLEWADQPLRLSVLLVADGSPRFTDEWLEHLQTQLADMATTQQGPLWRLSVATADLPLRRRLQQADPWTIPLDEVPLGEADSLVVVRLSDDPQGLTVVARGFSRFTQQWSPPRMERVSRLDDLVGGVFRGVHAVCGFVARIDRIEGDSVLLRPRGARLAVGRPAAGPCRSGSVLMLFRRTSEQANLEPLESTFLLVSQRGLVEASALARSRWQDPLADLGSDLSRWLAVEVPATGLPTELQVVTASDEGPQQPVPAADVFIEHIDGGPPTRIGATDPAGRIRLPPSDAALLMVHVSLGGVPVARVPLVPGQHRQRTLTIRRPEP